MMKYILFLILTWNFSAWSQIDRKLDAQVDKVLDTLEFKKFIAAIKKIKAYNNPGEIDEVDYEMKMFFDKINFWFYFDPVDYQATLKRNLRISFNLRQMKAIHQEIKKPFYSKLIKNLTLYREVFNEYHNLILVDKVPEPVMETRFVLLGNLFNLMGMSVQQEMAAKRLSGLLNSGLVTVPMLGKKDDVTVIETTGLESRNKELRKYLLLVLGERLKKFRHYEIREFIRNVKKNPNLKKFTQLLVNFHYMYLFNYMSKVEQDKMRQLKALRPDMKP